jgi:sensor histidine kinase YesM
MQPDSNISDFLVARISQTPVIIFSFLILLFYGNAYFLLPELFFKQKKVWYFLAFLLLAIAFYLLLIIFNVKKPAIISGVEDPLARASTYKLRQIRPFLLFIISWVISSIIHYAARLRKVENKLIENEKEKIKAELAFLNAQINPHFLFNTLNNIYSLSISNSPKASASILGLSKILRYITSEIHNEMVPLEKELTCIEEFIKLQKLRLSTDTVRLKFEINGSRLNKKIAPLLLMTFIENAFKYGVSNERASPIDISIDIHDDRLEFYSKNLMHQHNKSLEHMGLGILNAKKRLDHLYSGKYSLTIDRNNELYEVKLNLPV